MYGNNTLLIGYVGQHLLSRTLQDGSRKVSIRLATHHRRRTKDPDHSSHTVWHDVVAYDGVAEFAERSFVKGSRMMVEGNIVYRNYQRRDGTRAHVTEIKARFLTNLDR